MGRVSLAKHVTPCVTETLIMVIKLRLVSNARANQSSKVEIQIKINYESFQIRAPKRLQNFL
jgi:hypothetical protein